MPVDLAAMLTPGAVALVTQECQGAVVGEQSLLPELAAEARRVAVPNIARLASAARAVGVPVVHCVAVRRADGLGASTNAPLFTALARSGVPLLAGTPATTVAPEIGPDPRDVVLQRLHGVGPMADAGLDSLLRNLGVRTIVAVGVSVNIGLTDLVVSAVNAGYAVVLPADAVAGVPPSYAADVLRHTLRLLATVVGTGDVLSHWRTP